MSQENVEIQRAERPPRPLTRARRREIPCLGDVFPTSGRRESPRQTSKPGASISIRKLTTLAGLALAVAALSPASAPAKAGGTDRPWKSSATATATLDLVTLRATSAGSGHAAHLGKVTQNLTIALTPTGPGTFTGAGTTTIVAANGDQLFGTFTETLTTTGLHPEFAFVITITGGTGRFADASGRMTGTGSSVINLPIVGATVTSRQTFDSEGTITY
jgi:hypothetical protein